MRCTESNAATAARPEDIWRCERSSAPGDVLCAEHRTKRED